MEVNCQAVVVTAPSSGSGKTVIVAALAYLLRKQGKKVRVFKTGPDFIDPQFLSYASGEPVYQLDFWMCGFEHCRTMVADAAQDADIILIEGVMGMFDGKCSSADIAEQLGIPVMLVVDAGKMVQTFGAIVQGLTTYNNKIDVVGVIANRVGSTSHAQMLKESLNGDVQLLGYLDKSDKHVLPERHLGLVSVHEIHDIDAKLQAIAGNLAQNLSLSLPEVTFTLDEEEKESPKPLACVRIAVARDAAFSFIYQANLDLLRDMGARLEFFSPLAGDYLPVCDALYLPGGYPELHLKELSQLAALRQDILSHYSAHKVIFAECGGMLFLNDYLTDTHGSKKRMMGILQAQSVMQPKLVELGLVEARFTYNKKTEIIRGHSFHYSTTQSKEEVCAVPVTQRGKTLSPIYKKGSCIASYTHFYFASNPQLVADIFLGKLQEKPLDQIGGDDSSDGDGY